MLLSAGSVAARDFTIQTLSDPTINSRLPSISETGLVAWQGYTINDAEYSMSQRSDVLSSPNAQRSDIYAWKDNEVKNMTMEDIRITGRSERATVFNNSIVFMARFRYNVKSGLPFELSKPVKNEEMSQMESEYPTLFEPPTSAVEAEENPQEPSPEAKPEEENAPKEETKAQPQDWRSSGGAGDVAVIRPGGEIERISPGTHNFSFPVISEAGIAFQCGRGWPYGYEILAWQPDATNLMQITTNYFYVLNPQIEGQDLVFQAWDGNDYEIFLYRFDTKQTEQITNNQFDDIYPVVSGGEIAWVAHPTVTAEIFLMRDGVIRKISEGTEDNAFPSIWKGRVVWQGYDDTDLEIYYFNGRRTIKLTSNIWDDMMPKMNNGLIAWMSYVDNWDSEIMALDLSDNIAVQLTDNDDEDSHVETAGEKVVWQTINDAGGLIQLAVPDAPRPEAVN